MNIVFVSSEFPLDPNQSTGGIGTYLQNLSDGLINSGHKVTILTRGDINRSTRKKVNVILCNWGVDKINFLNKKIKFKFLTKIFNFIKYPLLFSFEVYIKLKQIEKRLKIDIIEGNDYGGELFFYLLFNSYKIPVVLRLHTPGFVIQKYNNEPLNMFYRIMKIFEVFCLNRATSLFSPSKSLAEIISKELKKPVKTIIPYPFKPLFSAKKFKRNRNLVLYAGKLQVKKGVFHLIEAVPKIINRFPKTKFMFVGPDTLFQGKSVMKMLIDYTLKNKLTKNVIIQKETTKEEIYKYYQKALITVIPSIWENFPFVCLEAMSQGSVVIATSEGGLSEIINHNINGLLFNINKSSDLGEKIIRFLKSSHSSKIPQTAARYIENNYNLNKISRKTISYYKRIIKTYIINNNPYI